MDINRVKLMLSGQGETNRRADSNAVCVCVRICLAWAGIRLLTYDVEGPCRSWNRRIEPSCW